MVDLTDIRLQGLGLIAGFQMKSDKLPDGLFSGSPLTAKGHIDHTDQFIEGIEYGIHRLGQAVQQFGRGQIFGFDFTAQQKGENPGNQLRIPKGPILRVGPVKPSNDFLEDFRGRQ